MVERIHTYDFLDTFVGEILSLIKPAEHDKKQRLHAIHELADSVCSVQSLRGAYVKPFGSFVSNLYAKSGDLDLSIDLWNSSNLPISKNKKQHVLRELMRTLKIRGVARSMRFVPNARVPVLQYISNSFGISCDISVDNYPGRIKSKILYWINTLDERFGDMVLLVKEWAKAQNINDPKNGTLNSYSLCLLVIFHFQTCEPPILPPLKEIYDGNVAEMASYDEKHVDEICAANVVRFQCRNISQRNQSSLGHLLASFFHEFFCIRRLSSVVISTYTGRYERIQDNPSWMAKSYSLWIEDPFERPDNAARAVGMEELERIGSAFNHVSYRFIASARPDRDELVSLLCTPAVASVLGGRIRANRYITSPPSLQLGTPVAANLYDDQRHNQTRGFTGSRSTLTSPGYAKVHQLSRQYPYQKHPQAYDVERPTGQYQNSNRRQVYDTGVQAERPYQHGHAQLHAGLPTAGKYQNQRRRRGYSPDKYAVTSRYEPVGGRWFHDGPAWDSVSQKSSNTAWQR
ncbi:hypothetical protein ACP4OV_019687 [Aristida adscensionis]